MTAWNPEPRRAPSPRPHPLFWGPATDVVACIAEAPAQSGNEGNRMRQAIVRSCLLWLALAFTSPALAQDGRSEFTPQSGDRIDASTFSGLRARSIGPALMSGRIGDFAVDPNDHAHYFVAVCSGNVWRTDNGGTTYQPVFDSQGSYSIGCLAMDPTNPKVVWVGTGENNSQRSVSFGDGVYKTTDGGKSWEHKGLPESEHIGMIAIDPRDSDVVYVAAQGPLWSDGGDRGLYKTTDGGETWERILHISDKTGINEVHLDPRDPDVIYASAYQRRRRVWTLINGGPESGLYKSTDAGQTWREIESGLPSVSMGRIGLDISPVNPDVVYAIVEAAEDHGGFYRSSDRGETWEKRSSYMTTSPQYYNEIVADPNDVDRVYALDTFLHVTTDGGANFERVPITDKHVDDHALWIDPDDSTHMLVGSDGGIYETFDRGENWRFTPNLPITQFYRVAVDNSEPFYFVYGGTQDNNTQGGPSRTLDRAGITNADWFITVGGDGFEPAVDPENPNIVYSQWQYGGLVRFDRASGEIVDIKPRERPGDEPYVWNWDSPLLISPHSNTRLYYAADRLFRSEDRGDSWAMISPDLTRGINRNELEVMGEVQPVDAVAKHKSTSIYGNIVALDESPLVEGLLYAGTDDGLVHVSPDGGETWRKISAFPGIPHLSYVSGLTASRHDPDTVFATFDNHKSGDFEPYALVSRDRGQSWESIAGDLPERHVVYALREDHENPNLLFVGTEFGAFFTLDAGEHWHEIAGVPTISVQDIEIQRRENDLVMATFGRSFYILDDYTPIRLATQDLLERDAHVFPVKDALLYVPRSRLGMWSGRGFQGASYYAAENPPFGAVITYHLADGLKTLEQKREEDPDAEYPSPERITEEREEPRPAIVLTIRDADDEIVRRIEGPTSKGMHRVAWDLRYPDLRPISLRGRSESPWAPSGGGHFVAPGVYSVSLSKRVGDETEPLTGPVSFEVVPLNLSTFDDPDPEKTLAFRRKVADLHRAVAGAIRTANEVEERLAHIRVAIQQTPEIDQVALDQAGEAEEKMREILVALRGDPVLSDLSEPQSPSISGRVGAIVGDQWYVTSPPTQTQRDQYSYAADEFAETLTDLRSLIEQDVAELERMLEEAGAPYTPGRLPEWDPSDRPD